MWSNRQFFIYLFIFNPICSYITTSNSSTKFTITLKTPGNELSPTQLPYKSIHVKYMFPNSDNQWNIVAIEPFIQTSNEMIQQMTVHICQVRSDSYQSSTIWYDDETYCNGARSMLIYQWASYSSISTFRIVDDLGFQFDKSKFIVLTVIYSKERQIHNEQSGIIFNISTLIPRFHVGTILVGYQQRGIRFSCRSSNYPRLLNGVKALFSKTNNSWWRIYAIRNRNFRKKSVQLVLNSTISLKRNKTDLETVPADIFLVSGDYIIIECTQVLESNCKFLIFYTYKNIQYKYFDENDHTCQNNNYPDLFKLLPSTIVYESTQIPSQVSTMHGITICVFLFVIWISIIIGCVIMRRIRGLVNFRTEPTSSFSNQKTNPSVGPGRSGHDHQKTTAEGDHIAQLDVEHMGLMN